MRKGSALNLIEAMNTNRQKISAVLGLLAIGFSFLSIYLFGRTAKLSLLSFSLYYLTSGFFIYLGWSTREKNVWFSRLFALFNGLLELMGLAGWIWVLFLAQENPGGRYEAISNPNILSLIVFFFLTNAPGFVGLLISLYGMRQSPRKEQ